ncbi:aminopeptidase N-like [Solea solea]|uniref:aminopeptidase N-like n=1 Tax=Solea solea TaxID=90069 RepID=UPI00272D7787|nr:aminopeptidase N-like [Solea solea]
MPKNSHKSKFFASVFIVLVISIITAIITMVIFYQIQTSTMNPTPRPTFPPTTTVPPLATQLPRSIIPERYQVSLKTHFYNQIMEPENVTASNQTTFFTGNSTVYFECVQATSTVHLHIRELTVWGAVVKNINTKETIECSTSYDEELSEFLEIQLSEELKVGENYSLFLKFEGFMSPYLEGFYLSMYNHRGAAHHKDSNTERFIAATQMEPTFARHVFPCLDEPDLKAVFEVTIIHRKDTMALGNNRMKTDFIDGEWKYTIFEPTPRMSTYLFAFVVSDFTATESSHDSVTIRTFARPEATAAGHAHYAANITGKILSFYEKYFQIDFSLPKLDQVALPDLDPAGMENWGLVTYQERAVLYEEGVSSLLLKENIADIIAHELAHQWFGNLVTMKWWNELWLKEGFSTYMSNLAVDDVEPSFRAGEMNLIRDFEAAFMADALASSHPLVPPQDQVQTADEIQQMYDVITYKKGALVLRMLADIVGERDFKKGINMYLEDFRCKSADQNDLWRTIQQVLPKDTGIDIAMVMDTWTKQSGFPVITINTTTGEFYQKRFLYNDSSQSNVWWSVHITSMSNSSVFRPFLLETSDKVRKEEFISKNGEWILANINCTGFYRVNYNLENWHFLLTQLETEPQRIPLMNRWQLVDDAFNLARAKLVNVTLALNSTRFLRNETLLLPWKTAMSNLDYFVHMFDRSEVYGPMQAYLRQQVTGLYNFFRNDTDHSRVPEDHSLQHLQMLAVKVACSNGLPECVTMATKMFAEWMNNNTNNIHTNLRSEIYCHAVAAGGKAEWEFAWQRFESSEDTSEKEQLRQALSCTKKIWLLNRYLEYTLNPDKIRLMDVDSTIFLVSRNVVGQALAWNFIRANWEYVSKGNPALLVVGVASRFSTQFELEELQRFASDYELMSATRAAEQSIEQTQVNIQWVNDNKDIVHQWFDREMASRS